MTIKTNTKRHFDPTDINDLMEYKFFKNNGKWASVCPFELVWPFVNVPLMIDDQIVNHYLKSYNTVSSPVNAAPLFPDDYNRKMANQIVTDGTQPDYYSRPQYPQSSVILAESVLSEGPIETLKFQRAELRGEVRSSVSASGLYLNGWNKVKDLTTPLTGSNKTSGAGDPATTGAGITVKTHGF